MAEGKNVPITVHFPVYAVRPKKDPITLHPIPEPEPDKGRDTSKYEYVEVPDTDMFNKPYQGASINGIKFERGKTYFLDPAFAKELRDRIKIGQRADIRLLQSHPDLDQPAVMGDHGPLGVYADKIGL